MQHWEQILSNLTVFLRESRLKIDFDINFEVYSMEKKIFSSDNSLKKNKI